MVRCLLCYTNVDPLRVHTLTLQSCGSFAFPSYEAHLLIRGCLGPLDLVVTLKIFIRDISDSVNLKPRAHISVYSFSCIVVIIYSDFLHHLIVIVYGS